MEQKALLSRGGCLRVDYLPIITNCAHISTLNIVINGIKAVRSRVGALANSLP